MPAYWKPLDLDGSLSLSECSTKLQYRKIFNYLADKPKTLNLEDRSCKDMSIVANTEEGGYSIQGVSPSGEIKYYLVLRFHYLNCMFQRISNVREFGFESLWSSMGGLLGFFLGYSLLQLPDLFPVGTLATLKNLFQ